MNTKFQNKLIKAHRLLRKKENSKNIYHRYGIECGNGWASILDLAFKKINHHIENPAYEPEKLTWIKDFYNKIFWNLVLFKICKLLPQKQYEWCFTYLSAHPKYIAPKNKINFEITQIKEKFGGLRIYHQGGDAYIEGIISFAESLSYQVCENCGSNQDVSQNKKGWIKTYCKECQQNF